MRLYSAWLSGLMSVTERQQIFPVGYDNLHQVMLLPEEFLHEVIDFMFFTVIKV